MCETLFEGLLFFYGRKGDLYNIRNQILFKLYPIQKSFQKKKKKRIYPRVSSSLRCHSV